ncbi:hydroxymethylpyrimidine/phosphomethylpyrimidine kinase [Pedobacter sp. SYSU D00535]|uniref:hydroxymethylpyrimidine/phosphomethylpyrimidine kinase n=1 Tax=Pedobacter sp. SYSU D00535 TaxID=2810308 RepID=UPI001A96DD29|nr:hydroxymethylpyrimidine/phosphomethylpyrimidine kinase [Pedobacter sp. SYSU D00535]
MNQRPYVLSIAGFDPSAGAGVLADVKTFEQHEVYGFGVCSALTVQNDQEFERTQWLEKEQIMDQVAVLTRRFRIDACKIGIVPSMEVLLGVLDFLKAHNPSMCIVLDPVLKATAGYSFHTSVDPAELRRVLTQLSLVTPNYEEKVQLDSMLGSPIEAFCNVLLKGGHHPARKGVDVLYENGKAFEIPAGVAEVQQKHGSGCVLASAITARLALGNTLLESCRLAKTYTEVFLNSNNSLLGYHHL